MPNGHTILIADDNAIDPLLWKRTLRKAGIMNPIREVRSGAEALAYLKAEGKFSDRIHYPFPTILLLDLCPHDGPSLIVLEWVRNKPLPQGLLIVVLRRAEQIKHARQAHSLGADIILTRPCKLEHVKDLIRSFREYWLLSNPQTSDGGAAQERNGSVGLLCSFH